MQKLKLAGNFKCKIVPQYRNSFEKVTEKTEKEYPREGVSELLMRLRSVIFLFCFVLLCFLH